MDGIEAYMYCGSGMLWYGTGKDGVQDAIQARRQGLQLLSVAMDDIVKPCQANQKIFSLKVLSTFWLFGPFARGGWLSPFSLTCGRFGGEVNVSMSTIGSF